MRIATCRLPLHHPGAMLAAALLLTAPAGAQVVTTPTHTAQPDTPPAPPPPAFFSEPHLLTKAIARMDSRGDEGTGRPRAGFYPEFGHMVTGAGWISIGPGYRMYLLDGRAMADMSAAISWRGYKSAQATLEFGDLASGSVDLGVKGFWEDFTQNRFYGVGQDTLESNASDYRVHAVDVVGYSTWRATRKITVVGSLGVLNRPGISSSTGPFDRDEPDTTQMFPDAPAAGLAEQPRFVHIDATVLSDTRDAPSHATSGRIYRATWSTHQDVTGGAYTFDRYDLEFARFVPVVGRRGVLVLHWWGSFTDTSGSDEVPFYMQPSLGGNNTLRGYADYRFHDRHMMVANIESRWTLMPHVDGAVFFDAGNVGARLKDLDFDRTSWGFGFRLHGARTTLARFDVGKSDEGWRFLFKLSDALRLGRLTRRMEVLPFAP